MPTISVPQSLLKELLKKHGISHDAVKMGDQLPLMGTDIDNCDEETLDIEIFPDRPDLLSGETLAHAIRPFLHGADADPEIKTSPSGITMHVEKELKGIRPVIMAAVVRGISLPEDAAGQETFIKGLMDHQEKLHFALGRGRKRASIGVHDLETIKPPFRVVATSGKHSFIPLGEDNEMDIDAILTQHPKGIDYAHLLESMESYPLIVDANEDVLSFPPIINGNHTTVTNKTRDFFIDVTGWDPRACEASLMLICLQLQERGGTIETVEITTCEGDIITTPNGKAKTHYVPEELVTSLLGRSFTDAELSHAINRMGGRFSGKKDAPEGSPKHASKMSEVSQGGSLLEFVMPRWRFDILHPVDLVEDIAIGHGYEDLGEDLPVAQLTAQPREDHHMRRRLRDSMQGLGLMQIQSLTLSNQTDQFTNMRWQQEHHVTAITNPITIDHTMLRQFLLPGLLKLLSSNRHHDLPQGVYELGTVVRNHMNYDRLAFLNAERSGGFAAVRGRIQAMCIDLGIKEWRAEPIEAGDGPWLAGRGAKLIVNDTWVGCFGELDPSVCMKYELRVPINGAELDVTALAGLLQDPV